MSSELTVECRQGGKCVRCLKIVDSHYGMDKAHPRLCFHCTDIMNEDFVVIDGKFVRKDGHGNGLRYSFTDFLGRVHVSDDFWR